MAGLQLHWVILISFIDAFAALEECGRSIYAKQEKIQHMDRIVGGIPSEPGAWPWMAALAVKGEDGGPDFRCGGSLISDRLVLTAAHCTREPIHLVRLGVNSLHPNADNKTDVLVKKMIDHDGFDFPKHEHDIALLLLSRRVVFNDWIRPICLPRTDILKNGDFGIPYVAGWGDVIPGEGVGSLILMEVPLPIQDLEKCRAKYAKVNETITDQNLCAGHDDGGKDACQGDSGGPLMLGTGEYNDTYFVIGVVSFGRSCALANFPGVFTNVYAYMPWIEKILEKIQIARSKKSNTVAAQSSVNQRSMTSYGEYRKMIGTKGLKIRYL